MYTQFHPRSPNVTQAGVPDTRGFRVVGWKAEGLGRGSQTQSVKTQPQPGVNKQIVDSKLSPNQARFRLDLGDETLANDALCIESKAGVERSRPRLRTLDAGEYRCSSPLGAASPCSFPFLDRIGMSKQNTNLLYYHFSILQIRILRPSANGLRDFRCEVWMKSRFQRESLGRVTLVLLKLCDCKYPTRKTKMPKPPSSPAMRGRLGIARAALACLKASTQADT